MQLLRLTFAPHCVAMFVMLASNAFAMDPLEGIRIEAEINIPPYARSLYDHWIDDDHDCQNTRHEVLQDESLAPVTFTDVRECSVKTGFWYDPYTGRTYTDASDVDIDHLVALKEAHVSGGYAWDAARRRSFANDRTNPRHLIAVDDAVNQNDKSDNDPAEWLPGNQAYRCGYVQSWIEIKRKWSLAMDPREAEAIRAILGGC